jgi:hypothetical protein
MRHAVLGHLLQIEQPVTGADVPLNHPIERTAVEQFVDALGHHPGDVDEFERLLLLTALGDTGLLPINQVLDGLHTDAQLYEMNGHAPVLAKPDSPAKTNLRRVHNGVCGKYLYGARRIRRQHTRNGRTASEAFNEVLRRSAMHHCPNGNSWPNRSFN